MTKCPISMHFIGRLSEGILFLSSHSFEIQKFIRGWKLATKFKRDISTNMPARPKKHKDMGCEYHYSKLQPCQIHSFSFLFICLQFNSNVTPFIMYKSISISKLYNMGVTT